MSFEEKGYGDELVEDSRRDAVPFPAIVPQGTHIEGNVKLLDTSGQVRLVPTPRDPLTWGPAKKWGLLITVAWFSVMSLSIVGGFGALAPIFFGIYIPQGVPPAHIARLLTWPSLFTGIGNFVLLPAALVFGRRPVFLLASLLLVASSAWAAKSGSSFESHLGARLLQGLSAGATESLLPLIITDMTYIHERAFYFGAYWVAQSVLTAVLNVGSTYEAVNLAWPWYYWIFVILASIGTIMVFFLAPETKFHRPAFAIDGKVAKIDAFGNMVILSDDEARLEGQSGVTLTIASDERPFTYAEALKPWSEMETNSLQLIRASYYHMFLALGDPAILYALGASSIVLGVNICQSLSFGSVLGGAAYHWPSQNIGLIYLGALPAGALAMFTSGWGGDKINLWLAKRNGGVHLPEHRLPSLIVPAVTGFLAAVMYGICIERPTSVHWFSIVFSNNWCTYTFICVLITSTTYAVEAMTHHAGAALVMVVGGKNLISFGMATAIVPLVNSGQNTFANCMLGGIEAGWMLLGIPLYFLMPRFRKWKSQRAAK